MSFLVFFYRVIVGIPAGRLLGNARGTTGAAQAIAIGDGLQLANVGDVPTLSATATGEVAPHASSHAQGGTDPVTVAQDQVTGLTAALAALVSAIAAKLSGTTGSTPNAVAIRGANSSTVAASSATIDPTTGDLVINRPGGGSITISKKSGANTGARITVSDNAGFDLWNAFANSYTNLYCGEVQVTSSPGLISNVYTPAGPRFAGNMTLGWRYSSPTNMGGTTAPDTQIGCGGAGVVRALDGTTGYGTFRGLIEFEPVTFGTVPTPSIHPRKGIAIVDRSNRWARSDGTNWVWVDNNEVIS